MITLETLAPVAATGMFNVAWLMVAVPAVSAAVLLLFGSILDRIGHWVAVAAVLFSFSIAACLFAEQLLSAPDQRAVGVVADSTGSRSAPGRSRPASWSTSCPSCSRC